MCIVTGPSIELAVTLIDRLKRLFTAAEKQPFSLIRFDTKETVIELNRVHIEAYPSHHLSLSLLVCSSFQLTNITDTYTYG